MQPVQHLVSSSNKVRFVIVFVMDLQIPSDLDELQQLSEEFDTLGLVELNFSRTSGEYLADMIYNTRQLVRIYKSSLQEHSDLELNNSQLEKDNEKLKKRYLDCTDEITEKEIASKKLENTICLLNETVKHKTYEIKSVSKKIEMLKRMLNTKEDELKHTIQRLESEIYILRERNKLEIGKYVSNDSTTAQIINKYKLREDVYKDTIKELQTNNQLLLDEILNLQSQVAKFIPFDSTTK